MLNICSYFVYMKELLNLIDYYNKVFLNKLLCILFVNIVIVLCGLYEVC